MRLSRFPIKSVCLACLVVLTIILHWIPRATEITLHILTERMSFSLSGTGDSSTLLEGLPLSSLQMIGFASLPIDVREMQVNGERWQSTGGRITLKPLNSQSYLTFEGDDALRLTRLELAPGAHVTVYTDQGQQMLLRVKNPQVSSVELAVLGRFMLTVKDVALLDAQGKAIVLGGTQPVQTLDITPTYRNLIFEQTEESPFTLAVGFSPQLRSGKAWNIPLAFVSRLKVSRLDFTREENNAIVSTIHDLWIEPLIPKDKSKKNVYLKTRKDDGYILQALRLSENGLHVELTTATDTLKVGKAEPLKNVMPSMLEYLVNHVVIKTVFGILGIGS